MAIKAPTSGLNLASPPSLNSYFFNGAGALRSAPVRRIKSLRFRSRAFQIQMNLFDRIARVAKSYANAVVNSLEDPEKILDQAVLEMNDDLIKMRQTTAQVLATQKRLENKYKAAEQSSDDWYKRAQLALQKGDEELAREALKRRKSYADSASSLKTQLDQQKGVIESLISNSKVLESKIQEAKAKKDTLKARAQTAKTATKVNEMLGNVNTSSALSAFDKMEEKVMTMESQAEALNQLNADELDGKFAMLETSSVDDDLANMKKELSGVSLIIGAILLLLTITSTIFAFISSTFVATRFLIILIFLVAASAAVVAAVAGLVAAVAATTIMTAAASITTLVGTVVVVATTISWISAFVITIVMGIAVVAVLGGSKRKRQKRRSWW